MRALWMVVAGLLFSVMGACVKWASQYYGIAEIVFYRSLIGVVILYAFALWRRTATRAVTSSKATTLRVHAFSLATPHAGMHFRRSVNGTIALALWFYATTLLPLGTAMTLNYASSLYLAAAVIGIAIHQRRQVDSKLAAAVLIGFVGVLLVLQPSFTRDQGSAALAGLLSGVFAAVAYWHLRDLGRLGEPEWRTVFYFSLTGSLLGLAGSLITGLSTHTPEGVLLLAGVGLSALLAQLAMTRAYGSG
ncbi:MAG: EamA family transporter, partial [Burkholderiaceae bacterium]|nr:EamA family transporter [Burkholderiaceae bacterium]